MITTNIHGVTRIELLPVKRWDGYATRELRVTTRDGTDVEIVLFADDALRLIDSVEDTRLNAAYAEGRKDESAEREAFPQLFAEPV